MEQKVNAAILPDNAFDAVDGTFKENKDGGKVLTTTCGGDSPANRSVTKKSGKQWYMAGSVVRASVTHLDVAKPDGIIDDLRKLISCGSYVETWTEQKATVTVNGEVTLPKTAGTDGQIAWCESQASGAGTCWAIVVRGPFVAGVQVATAKGRAEAEKGLTVVSPIAAAALAK
ncbi:hypothetical protein [Lentzea sp. NBRC 105346]|uniref:hypothetical protein n=1 Tax=Lentzea sp. NBRC 105346 TaxID=3032205 RepID=UPI0025526647|nr:hypothetical protein [Lentzea sp. NBRC 105346]